MFRKFLVDLVEMWCGLLRLHKVSLFRDLHLNGVRVTRIRFFVIALVASFLYYVLPGYFFSMTAQQVGSTYHGLRVGAFSFDWEGISAYHGTPLVTPWTSILNIGVGFVLFIYVIVPLCYWKFNSYDARMFPIFSSKLLWSNSGKYKYMNVLTPQLELDTAAYNDYGKLYLSPRFALSIAFGFPKFTATLVHVALFHSRDIFRQSRAAMSNTKLDVHAKLMRSYRQFPSGGSLYYWSRVFLSTR